MPELLTPQPMLEEQLQAPFGEPDPSVDGGFLQAEQAYAEIPYEQPDIAPAPPTLSQRFAASRIGRTLLGGFVSFGLASGGVAMAASPAHAESSHTYTIENTNGDGVWLHGDPGLGDSGDLITVIPENTSVTADCYVNDSPVGKKNNPAWLRITYDGKEGFVSDAFTSSKWNKNNTLHDQGLEFCGEEKEAPRENQNSEPPADMVTSVSYDREAAVRWARSHSKDKPPYDAACTQFVSQALWAGGLPKESGEWTMDGPGYGSFNWRPGTPTAWHTKSLLDYIMNEYPLSTYDQLDLGKNKVPKAEIGDIIAYDWQGDGAIDHLTFITDIVGDQYPEVAEWSPLSDGSLPSPYVERGWTRSEVSNLWLQEKTKNKVAAFLLHIDPTVMGRF